MGGSDLSEKVGQNYLTINNSKEEVKQFLREHAMEEIKECRPKTYDLLLGELSYESAVHLYKQYREKSMFEKDPILETMIEQGEEESKKLVIFLVQQYICDMLNRLGVTYSHMYGNKLGCVSMLVQAGCCNSNEAMNLLNKQWNLSSISRPEIPMYFKLEKGFIYPNAVNRKYVELCFGDEGDELKKLGIIDLWQENYDDYCSRAALLLEYQYTFKRYMAEWEACLNQYTNVSLADIVNAKAKMPCKFDQLGKKFLLIILIDCLCKVYGKWKLSEETLSENTSCYEVAKLLEDGVLEKDELCSYYLSENDDTELIIKKINTYRKKLSQTDGYTILYRLEESKEDLELFFVMLEDEMNCSHSMKLDISHRVIAVQTQGEMENKEFLDICSYSNRNELLMALWNEGVMIPWDQVYSSQDFMKVELPVYQFQRNTCWIPHTGSFVTGESQVTVDHNCESEVWEEKKVDNSKTENQCRIWEERFETVPCSTKGFEKSVFVVFSEDAEFCKKFYDTYVSTNQRMIVVCKDAMEALGEMEVIQITQRNRSEYQQALSEIKLTKEMMTVVFDWDSYESMDEIQILSQMHMFYQALYQCRKTKDVKILSIVSGTKNRDGALALGSLFRNIYYENKGIKGLNLILSKQTGSEDKAIEAGIAWNAFSDRYEVEYSNGMLRYACYEPIEKQENSLTLKKGGSYIITGGMGGLGYEIAKWCAKKEQIHLILVGRTKINENIQKKVNELKKYGTDIEYIGTDISQFDDTDRMIRDILKRYQKIDGIIHAAGTYNTGYFVQKKEEDIVRVVQGKIQGAINLDECTKELALDFVVFISSISAMIGDEGIADYAYGNGYLNVLARKRERLREQALRKGRTYAIALSILQDGGIVLNETAKEEYVQRTGFDLIKKDAVAVSIMDIVFQYRSGVYVIGKGDKEKIGEKLMNKKSENSLPVEESQRMRTSELTEQVEDYVKEILANEFDMEKNDLDAKESLEEYGLDSIVVQKFNKVLAKDLSDVSKTILFECTNVKEVAEYLVENYYDTLEKMFHVSMQTTEVIETEIDLVEETVRNQEEVKVTVVDSKDNEKRNDEVEEDGYAIIGVSGKFPGADTIAEFWNNLKEGVDSITDIPIERWNVASYPHDYFYCKKGGFLNHVDQFDAEFFRISAREAINMDPQERLMLETSWNVLEDAGYTKDKLEALQREVGVFVGAAASSYQMIAMDEWQMGNIEVPNTRSWSISNRISYVMNLNGPSMTIDSACSSSLSALKLAINSMKLKECKAAIVGGVNLVMHPAEYAFRGRMHMLSEEGHCNAFGKQADGYVPGEGVAAIMVKPLQDAIKDHDRIYGVIRGIAINHGGRTNGFTVPNPNAQADLIVKAAKDANINLRKLTYIEAHGTGTALGDPIEVEGLTKAFKQYDALDADCALGTVKSNIGHLEAASGIAGIIKVLLQMQHNELVPSLHAEELNPDIRFKNGTFHVQRYAQQWMVDKTEHCFAGVSSFGAGGTNVHVILENYPLEVESSNHVITKKEYLIPISARNEEDLKRAAKILDRFVEQVDTKDESAFLRDFSYTLLTGRDNFSERLAFFASNLSEVQEKLKDYVYNGEQAEGCFVGHGKNPYQILFSGEEGNTFIQSIIAHHAKEKLAMIWSMGFQLDWKAFSDENDGRIISIPSYALNSKSYWIGKHPVKIEMPEVIQTTEPEHPEMEHSIEPKLTEVIQPVKIKIPEMIKTVKIDIPVIKEDKVKSTKYEVSNLYQKEIEEKVRSFVGETLFVEPEEIDLDSSLYDLGLDSILGVQLVKSINEAFKIQISATNIYDYPNIQRLAEFILSQIGESKDVHVCENKNASEVAVQTVRVEQKHENSTSLQIISNELVQMVSDVLFIEQEEIDVTDSLYDLGLDSILGVELVKRINQRYNISIQASDIYTYVNIKDMAEYIASNGSDQGKENPRCDACVGTVNQVQEGKKEILTLKQSYHVAEFKYQVIEGTNKVELSPLAKEQQVNFKESSELNTQNLLREDNMSSPISKEQQVNLVSSIVPVEKEDLENHTKHEPIAIVGMSGRFPGADTMDEFWEMLLAGKNSVTEVPKERFHIDSYYSETQGELGRTYCRHGGYLKDVYHFDPTFFHISPIEAEKMNPQQRIFLEESWHAIEDAGYQPSSLSNRTCGVYVGTSNEDYKNGFVGLKDDADVMELLGNSPSFLPARISYFLNLKGPAIAFDTACSSSLTAIHHAVMGLRNGDCEMALAGGVTVINDINLYLTTAHGKMLSPTGQCHAFSETADGFVPSESVVVFLLKRLSQAVKDKDHIYGVIKGNAMNQDGRTNGITAPSALSQEMLEKEVFETYQIDPAKITYVEAHGTGTKLGDPIEWNALKNSFRAYTNKKNYCAIGSVKSNIGHTLACSGAVGIAKILMCFKHKMLLPEIEPTKHNSLLDVTGSPFYVNHKEQAWTVNEENLRMASVSSFGLSGTNCYMVLEEYQEPTNFQEAQLPYYLFLLSGKSMASVEKNLHALVSWVKVHRQTEQIGNVAYTLASGREVYEYRVAIIAKDYEYLSRIIEHGQYKISQVKKNSGNESNFDVGSEYSVKELEGIQAIAKCYITGQGSGFEHIYDSLAYRKISLPGYAFDREEYRIYSKNVLEKVEPKEQFCVPTVQLPSDLFYKNTWDNYEMVRTKDSLNGFKLALYTEDAIDLATQMVTMSAVDTKMTFSELRMEELRERVTESESITIYLLCFSKNPPSKLEVAKQMEALHGCQEVFQMIQSYRKNVRIVLGTNQCQQVFPEDRVIPNMAALIGYMKVAMKEFPDFDLSMIDLSEADMNIQNKESLIDAFQIQQACKKGEEIAYRNGEYYIKHLQQIEKPEIINQGFRKHGVYMILGGAGRIGSEMALYLANTYHATVILLGRSKENESIRNLVKQVEIAGGKARYLSVDATDQQALEHSVASVEQEFGKIHGVIHSAIYYKTSLIVEQSHTMVTEVTNPKIPATYQLAKAFAGKDLDFYLYFSSGDAYTALLGHSAYVAGSTYEDSYAIYQRQQENYPVKVVNWGFWESSKQQKARLDASGRTSDYAYLDGLESRGIQLITAEIGTTAVDTIVSCIENQMYVMRIKDSIKEHFDMKCIETKDARGKKLAGLKNHLMQLYRRTENDEQENNTMLKKLEHRLHMFE